MAFLLFSPPFLFSDQVSAATSINSIRLWNALDHTRVVLDIGGEPNYKTFELDNPLRLVVDMVDSNWSGTLPTPTTDDRYLLGIRVGQPTTGVTRFVLDLRQKVKAHLFQLDPYDAYGHRLVIDLNEIVDSTSGGSGAAYVPPSPVSGNLVSPTNDQVLTVAIDAGHGGEDPGARGPRGYREKIITMEIARRLKKVVDADPNMRGVLTRDGDYYIDLRKRTKKARDFGSDVFVSIHADAFLSSSVSGASVYALSESGASSEEARWLADQENASDLVGGVSLNDKDALLAEVLLDLSMTKTISDGREVGAHVLKQLAAVGKVHRVRVEQARFVVLKSPDIPSILVETGFLTNPDEEQRLAQKDHQEKLAHAIYRGLKAYQDGVQPPLNVARDDSMSQFITHKVKRGDTLSEIAEKYRVSVSKIKQHNRIRNDVVMLGQTLRVPR